MLKQIDVNDLKIGMYVGQLDRPWLETPFIFQGFLLESAQHIDEVRRFCEYVLIDLGKGIDTDTSVPDSHIFNKPPPPKPTRVYIDTTSLETEIKVAEELRKTAIDCIDNVFEAITKNQDIDVKAVKKLVNSMVESIVRNPDAQMCLTQLKNRDEYTAQHSINVCVLTLAFGRHLGIAQNSLNLLGLGALLHDVGKLKTPLEILNKPGRLTDEEFEIMKTHPEAGRQILKQTNEIPESVIDIALSHHERLAGHGYPNGLPDDQISPWSKIVAITDVYDAITSDRCYHDGMSPTQALTKMYEWRIRDFNPELLEQFIQCIGIYPIGTLVELNSGEVGIVISVNRELRLKPKVLLILDEDKNPYYPVHIVDLKNYHQDYGENPYNIQAVLEPRSYNIDTNDYMHEIKQAQQIQRAQEEAVNKKEVDTLK